jgi:hypothetical protein
VICAVAHAAIAAPGTPALQRARQAWEDGELDQAEHAYQEALEKQPSGTYFLGRYRVVDEIGIGGMASVHLARMDGRAASRSGSPSSASIRTSSRTRRFVHMFLDEARVAARISHPNVATVFELGKHEDTYWIAMEYLHGEPLREVMRRTEELGTPMPPEIACRVIADAAEGCTPRTSCSARTARSSTSSTAT